MDKFKKSISALLIFILLASIIVIFRSFLMAYIVEPIAMLFWAIWRIVSSINQNTYWIVLIALCIILMFRMIPFEEGKSTKVSYTYSYKPPTRVDHWQSLIKVSVDGKNENKKLRKSLKELLITVISHSEGIPALEAEKSIKNGITPLSPSSHHYLFSSNMQENKLKAIYFLPRWLRRWGKKYIHQNNSMIDEVLDYMETELEINDEK